MKYHLQGLDCQACAAKIEQKLKTLEHTEDINFNWAKMTVEIAPEDFQVAQAIIDKIEPGVKLVPLDNDFNADKKENKKKDLSYKELQPSIVRVVASLIILLIILGFQIILDGYVYSGLEALFYLIPYSLAGFPVIWGAFKNLYHGQVFNEKFLMTVATGGAFAIGEYPEAVAVMLFFAVGELMQNIAVARSKNSINALLDLKPETATVVSEKKRYVKNADEVEPGEVIEVKPGERVPLDGSVLWGTSYVDTSALTGENVPKKVDPEEEILAGSINQDGLLRLKVDKNLENSAVAKILDLVEKASSRKAPTERFITEFAGWYTPIVVGLAVILAVFPPIFLPGADFSDWVYRALILLVISCPCALVLSIPLSYFGGIGAASKKGILIKGANFIDAMVKLHTVVLDKTGTLTKGVFKVDEIFPYNGYDKKQILEYALAAEENSNHPIARSIREKAAEALGSCIHTSSGVADHQEIKGLGTKTALNNGNKVLIGNKKLLHQEGVRLPHFVAQEKNNGKSMPGTKIHLAVNGEYAGRISITDEIKPKAKTLVKTLKFLGVKRVIMLTGDDQKAASALAEELNIDEYYASLLPQDKLALVERFHMNLSDREEKLAYVGDGINDAPVITRADVGMAMGALGSDAAIEAADVVFMDDNLEKISNSIQLSKRTRKIVLQNIVFALGVKGLFMIMAAIGMTSMWAAVFADVGVTLIAVINATRILYFGY